MLILFMVGISKQPKQGGTCCFAYEPSWKNEKHSTKNRIQLYKQRRINKQVTEYQPNSKGCLLFYI